MLLATRRVVSSCARAALDGLSGNVLQPTLRRAVTPTCASTLSRGGVMMSTSSSPAPSASSTTSSTDPKYVSTFPVTCTLSEFVARYDNLESGSRQTDTVVTLAGRVVGKRQASSKLVFLDLEGDGGVHVQVMAALGRYGDGSSTDENKEAFKHDVGHVRRGDIVGVTGFPAKSKKGELSVMPSKLDVLATCLHDVPDRHFGLSNTDLRYRHRYLDMVVNPSVRDVFVTRSKVLTEMRRFFGEMGFLEVETPILAPCAGGAIARPFETHAKAFDLDLSLRIAPELALKQCVIGGLDRVFEIGKVFRNEGITPAHSPEFTSCEFYQAYADLDSLMQTTERLLERLCQVSTGGATSTHVRGLGVDSGEVVEVNFSGPYRRIEVVPALEEALGCELPLGVDPKPLLEVMQKAGVPLPPLPHTAPRLMDQLIGHFLEPQCQQPTFLCHHPAILSPLAHTVPETPEISDRFELFVRGKEVVNAYVELNDPAVQRQRFEQQLKDKASGDLEASAVDETFCEALEFGLPPTGGWGMGVDRIVMMLTKSSNIRDVLLFPLMKPLAAPSPDASSDDPAKRSPAWNRHEEV